MASTIGSRVIERLLVLHTRALGSPERLESHYLNQLPQFEADPERSIARLFRWRRVDRLITSRSHLKHLLLRQLALASFALRIPLLQLERHPFQSLGFARRLVERPTSTIDVAFRAACQLCMSVFQPGIETTF